MMMFIKGEKIVYSIPFLTRLRKIEFLRCDNKAPLLLDCTTDLLWSFSALSCIQVKDIFMEITGCVWLGLAIVDELWIISLKRTYYETKYLHKCICRQRSSNTELFSKRWKWWLATDNRTIKRHKMFQDALAAIIEKRLIFVGPEPALPMMERMLEEEALLEHLYQQQRVLRDAAEEVVQVRASIFIISTLIHLFPWTWCFPVSMNATTRLYFMYSLLRSFFQTNLNRIRKLRYRKLYQKCSQQCPFTFH